jgi:short-subunit dehydrogenase
MSSAAALKNVPRANAYAASKAGVEAFGGALRLELAHKGVDVGVAHPAWVSTGMISGSGSRAGESRSLPWPFSVVSARTPADLLVGAMAANSVRYCPAQPYHDGSSTVALNGAAGDAHETLGGVMSPGQSHLEMND